MTQTAVQAIKEVFTKDDFGRDTCMQFKDFWAYLVKKKMTREDVLKLKPDSREAFFMKWKHGMSDSNTNWEFEYTLRSFLKNFKDITMDKIEPSYRIIVKNRREFECYCDSIKDQINLWSGKREVPQEVQQLVDSVSGTLVRVE